jgi:hypothetical protein
MDLLYIAGRMKSSTDTLENSLVFFKRKTKCRLIYGPATAFLSIYHGKNLCPYKILHIYTYTHTHTHTHTHRVFLFGFGGPYYIGLLNEISFLSYIKLHS